MADNPYDLFNAYSKGGVFNFPAPLPASNQLFELLTNSAGTSWDMLVNASGGANEHWKYAAGSGHGGRV